MPKGSKKTKKDEEIEPENTPLGAEVDAIVTEKTGRRSTRTKSNTLTFRALHNFVFYRNKDMVQPFPEECYKSFWKGITVRGHAAPMTGEATNLVQSGWWDIYYPDLAYSLMEISNISGLHCKCDLDYRGGAPALYLQSSAYLYVLLAPAPEFSKAWEDVVAQWAKYSELPKSELEFDWVDVQGSQPPWWGSSSEWNALQSWFTSKLPAPSEENEHLVNNGSDDEGGDEDAPGSDDLTVTESQENDAEDAEASDGPDETPDIAESSQSSRLLRSATHELQTGSGIIAPVSKISRSARRVSELPPSASEAKTSNGNIKTTSITQTGRQPVKGKEKDLRSALKVPQKGQTEELNNSLSGVLASQPRRKRARIVGVGPEAIKDLGGHQETLQTQAGGAQNEQSTASQMRQAAAKASVKPSGSSADAGKSSGVMTPVDKRFPIVRDRVASSKSKVSRPAASTSTSTPSPNCPSQPSEPPGVVPPFTQIPLVSPGGIERLVVEQTPDVPMEISDSEEPAPAPAPAQAPNSELFSTQALNGTAIDNQEHPRVINRGGSAPPSLAFRSVVSEQSGQRGRFRSQDVSLAREPASRDGYSGV